MEIKGRWEHIKKRLKSMKLQAFIVVLLVGSIPMLCFTGIVSERYLKSSINQRVKELQDRGRKLSDTIVSKGFMVDQKLTDVQTEIGLLADLYDGRIVIINTNYMVIYDSYSLGMKDKYNIAEEVIDAMKGKSSQREESQEYIQLTLPIQNIVSKESNSVENKKTLVDGTSTESSIAGVIILSARTKDIYTIIDDVEKKSRIAIGAIFLIVLVIAYIYAHYFAKPLRKFNDTIDHMAEGYFDEKLPIQGYLEIQSMSESFNKMIGRIQQLESSRQEFVSNVSHELKTPITSIKVLADSLLAQEDAPAELYREFMVDITDEIERENKIINDLLSLVKLDKTAGEMNIANISINELLEQILKRLRPIAQKRNIELVFESFRPVNAEVDEVKLSLAISNLVENAIKYNFDDGWVRVSLNADHKFFYVKISDSGVGIPEDVQDHIFERFYRVDKARSRETGGTGLGLSITRNAILMHRGAIKVYSKEKEGTTFTVRVPLNYIA